MIVVQIYYISNYFNKNMDIISSDFIEYFHPVNCLNKQICHGPLWPSGYPFVNWIPYKGYFGKQSYAATFRNKHLKITRPNTPKFANGLVQYIGWESLISIQWVKVLSHKC